MLEERCGHSWAQRTSQGLSPSRPPAAQELCSSGANHGSAPGLGGQGPRSLGSADPRGTQCEGNGCPGVPAIRCLPQTPHPIPCTGRIPQAFGSTGCSRSTNPTDLKAEHHLGDGRPQAGTALLLQAGEALASGGIGHCPETPGGSWAQAAGGRWAGKRRSGTGTWEQVRELPVLGSRSGTQ